METVKYIVGNTVFWTRKGKNGKSFFYTSDEALKASLRVKAIECPDRVSILADDGDTTLVALLSGIVFGVTPGEKKIMVLEAVE